jgi:hypothetical protein
MRKHTGVKLHKPTEESHTLLTMCISLTCNARGGPADKTSSLWIFGICTQSCQLAEVAVRDTGFAGSHESCGYSYLEDWKEKNPRQSLRQVSRREDSVRALRQHLIYRFDETSRSANNGLTR